MRLSKISLATFFLLAQLSVSAQSLESIFTKGDRLIYQGREVTRSAKPGADSWTITIKKKGKVLERFETGDTMSKDWAKLGLFNFLGGRRKQLIVEGYSGGAHCCWQYRIVDLSPIYRVLYNSDDWNVGNRLTPVDLDKDGVFEFAQSVMTFDAARSLEVLLRYLYAGQERKAWDFFDENYKLNDKREIKRDIEKKLQDCALYQYLYRRGR